jgi:hypothetical protein
MDNSNILLLKNKYYKQLKIDISNKIYSKMRTCDIYIYIYITINKTYYKQFAFSISILRIGASGPGQGKAGA